MNYFKLVCSKTSILICMFGYIGSVVAADRDQNWEFTLQPRYVESTEIEFGGGSRVDINSDIGFGFGMGYNLNENFALRGTISWFSASYSGTRVLDTGAEQTFSSRLDSSTIGIGADYYLTKGRVSPYVNVSAGWTFVDTNIPAGLPQSICWWDPWWGYICDTYQPTVGDTEFSYSVALGLRFELSDRMFLRAGVSDYSIDYDNSLSSDNSLITQLDIGFSY